MEGDDALTSPTAPVAALKRSSRQPLFAHASEAELARILDFYAVRWESEPHVFPILWNLDGAVVESFSPDFYLPDFDTYVELTTLRQPLVRKKNRKLRRLRELYPDIRIKLFYARDFRALMLKYGKFGLVDALSGTSGQVVPVSAKASLTEDRDPPDGPTRTDAAATPDSSDSVAASAAVPLRSAPIGGTAPARRRRRRRASTAARAVTTSPDA